MQMNRIERILAKFKIKLTKFLEEKSLLIVDYFDEDHMLVRHRYTWATIFLGFVYFLFVLIRKAISSILIFCAVTAFLFLFGADIFYFLKHGFFELTSLGQLTHGPDFNLDAMVANAELKGLSKIFGAILSIPAFIGVPFIFWMIAHIIYPEEY